MYQITMWTDRRVVDTVEVSTEQEARHRAQTHAGPKQDKRSATFHTILAVYTEKKPKNLGHIAFIQMF